MNAYVNWDNMRAPGAELIYNSNTEALEGNIVVPKTVGENWNLEVSVLTRHLGSLNDDRGTVIVMKGDRDFTKPIIKSPIKKSEPPEIKILKPTNESHTDTIGSEVPPKTEVRKGIFSILLAPRVISINSRAVGKCPLTGTVFSSFILIHCKTRLIIPNGKKSNLRLVG